MTFRQKIASFFSRSSQHVVDTGVLSQPRVVVDVQNGDFISYLAYQPTYD
jgi:hypothetical protein